MTTTHDQAATAMLEAAAKISPELSARASEIETLRRMPDDIAHTLADQGFYRMWVPTRLGGLELPLAPSLEVFEALAKA